MLARTQGRIREDQSIEGVVLLGGTDVVPSRILSTIPKDLEGSPAARSIESRERDRLQVWSDDSYGDLDGDAIPELAVSRIPDGKDPALLLLAMTRPPVRTPFAAVRGVRNSRRPFADLVFAKLDGGARMDQCVSDRPGLPPYPLDGDCLYVMLHGYYGEGNIFRGEDDDGYPEAFSAADVPNPAPSVVFSGCCYGALAAVKPARDARPDERHEGRTARDSIALTCLRNGANAFVGCTAIHYSPDKSPFTYLGEPMHRYFWREIAAGQAPARALLNAKKRYGREIPHLPGGKTELRLIEHKILREFTCLGLGW